MQISEPSPASKRQQHPLCMSSTLFRKQNRHQVDICPTTPQPSSLKPQLKVSVRESNGGGGGSQDVAKLGASTEARQGERPPATSLATPWSKDPSG